MNDVKFVDEVRRSSRGRHGEAGMSMKAERDLREIATYEIVEAAKYLRLPSSTVRDWIHGQRDFKPVIVPAANVSPALSFVNLVEIHVLAAIRRHHRIPMPTVRMAVDQLDPTVSHPLANARFETDGVDLFVRRLGELVNLSRPKQRVMREVLEAHLHRIEWGAGDRPIALYPFTTERLDGPKLVAIDPTIAFGRLVIAHTGIPTISIFDRYVAGDSIDELADDYGRSRLEIEAALRCELPAAA